MLRLMLSLATSLVALAPAAYADEFPPRKPGLWEITMSSEQAPPEVTRTCIDAAFEAKMHAMGNTDTAGLCSRHDTQRSGNTVTGDSVCRVGSSQVTSHTVTTLTDDTAYTMVMMAHYDPPMFGGRADSKMTQEAKWLGPCGADMQPGDMIIHGQKMHIPAMPQGAHP